MDTQTTTEQQLLRHAERQTAALESINYLLMITLVLLGLGMGLGVLVAVFG